MPNNSLITDLEEVFHKYVHGDVLDIGGMGGDEHDNFPIRKLQKYAKRLVCVDAYENTQIDITNIEFHKCSIQAFETRDVYDTIFAGEIIEHISDQRMFLEQIYKLLAANGILIITTPNSTSLSDFYQILKSGKNPREGLICNKINNVYISGHILVHNVSTLQQLLDEFGFYVDRCFYKLPLGGGLIKNFIRRAILSFRPQLSSQIICIARKKNHANNQHKF